MRGIRDLGETRMSNFDLVRWMVTFFHSEGGWREEPDFPEVDFWYPNKDSSMKAGARVLEELKNRGDHREWKAAGHPDPYEVGAGRHPGGQWMLPPAATKIFDPHKVPPMDLSEEEWEAFDRALRDGRETRES